ncbi:MAG: hypothetical protein IJX72_06420 [Clostridia bacterium]|nr:hypothetical protein [Clostridia bacterium]
MKKLTALLLCLVLCLSVLAACDSGNTPIETEGETNATTTAPADDGETTAADAEETTAPADEETTAAGEDTTAPASDETQDPADMEYDPELYVVIRTAEDLMAFNKAVNEEGEYFDDMTVIFLDDIDMTGYTWTPLDGMGLFGVTFDGQGHTISNLQFADYEYEAGSGISNSDKGCGFVGAASGDLTFKDLTFDNSKVNAYDQSVGNFIGSLKTGYAVFENCKSLNFTADGWMDWNNQSRENGGHSISMRLAGFIGHILGGGSAVFTDCTVENIKLSGFHNLAGFVGYDGAGMLDEFAFTNCVVKNADFTFSYCLSENYTVDMPRKFVSVFYNGTNWVDNIDACVEMENSFEGVSFYDWTDDNAEYTPSDFRSWTQEEADAAKGN